MDRRTFLAGAAALATLSTRRASAQAVPNSAGTEPARLTVPPNACDCHMHIYDGRYPAVPNDALLFDLLGEWAPDAAVRHRILVRNPETLYGFPISD
jgi:predicted TIM-barrel fold metal-dependent hydrolase